MKNVLYILITVVMVLLSCGKTKENKEPVTVTDSSKIKMAQSEAEYLENRRRIEADNVLDSIRFVIVLNKALEIAQKNIHTNNFYEEFEITLDSFFIVKTTVKMQSFFSPKYQHLVIHREAPNNDLIDIYLVVGNTFKKVVSHDQWAMTYVSDTLKDINGDGYKDFVVNWYGMNGCCLKGFSDVYVYRSNNGTFTEQFEFINPTFSPKEKTVRGVCYGHPGETEMYTYKWKGETIDTLEYIAYEKNKKGEKTGTFVTSKSERVGDSSQIIKRLNTIPKEYTIIDGYDWFVGEGFE